MGTPVQGTTSQDADATAVPPVIVAGLDSEGNVVPILVGADGTVQIAEPA